MLLLAGGRVSVRMSLKLAIINKEAGVCVGVCERGAKGAEQVLVLAVASLDGRRPVLKISILYSRAPPLRGNHHADDVTFQS